MTLVALRIDFITLFPEVIAPYIRASIMGRASEKGLVSFGIVNPRDFAKDAHKTVDDSPFGGGPGMVMKADVLGEAIDSVITPGSQVVIFEPWGTPFTNRQAAEFSVQEHLILVCGHYEGLDGRIAQHYGAVTISIGDFVLTGGELPALAVCDAAVRQIPGALGDIDSLGIDSHSDGLLSGPQYTRPWEWNGLTPPDVLKSGDHGAVEAMKRAEALKITRGSRPDLFCSAKLSKTDIKHLL